MRAAGKESCRKATKYLEVQTFELKLQQKHKKVADHPDYIWGAVRHYQANPLADNSDVKSSSAE